MKLAPLSMALLLLVPPAFAGAADGWKRIAGGRDLNVFERDAAGGVPEVKVEGRIDSPPETVLAVLADVESYVETMPHTEVSKLVKREGDRVWLYSVVDPPLGSRRDYCVEITLTQRDDGTLGTEWKPANELAPAEKKGVVRVKVNDGSWTLEPTDGGKATWATYRLHVDPGGKVPKWIVEKTNRKSVPDAFEAVRKASTSKRYANAPSPLAR
ncbi:MAG TPA: START domain-containing protein [Vulgatibacter sp.]